MTSTTGRVLSKDEIIAEEDLVIDVQFLIQELLDEHGMKRSELAGKLGISPARLSQLMKMDANPTLRTLSRVAYALGERLCIDTKARRDHALASTLVDSVVAAKSTPSAAVEKDQSFKLETGEAASKAVSVIEASFARPWAKIGMRDVSNDQFSRCSEDDFELAAA